MSILKHKLFHLALFALVAIMPFGANSVFGSETPTIKPAIATNSDVTVQNVWWHGGGWNGGWGGHRWGSWGYRPYYHNYYNYYSPYYSYYPNYYPNCYYVWSNGSYVYYCN